MFCSCRSVRWFKLKQKFLLVVFVGWCQAHSNIIVFQIIFPEKEESLLWFGFKTLQVCYTRRHLLPNGFQWDVIREPGRFWACI